jgi:hypothetical protein
MNDILADLAGMQKSTGTLCARARIQRDHPELLEAFDKAVTSHFSALSVSDWFAERGVVIGQEAVRKHRIGACQRCRKTS